MALKTPSTVSIFQSRPDTTTAEETAFEPGFEYSRKLLPEVTDRTWCEGLARYLGRRLRRSPKDLTAHLQRIYALLAADATGEQLFAAAIDLNTALGSGGTPLQERVFAAIAFALTEQQREFLIAIRSGASDLPLPADVATTIPRNDTVSVPIVAENKGGR
jgi:hypothetical protein